MIEFKMLIPVVRNENKKEHCPTTWKRFEDRLTNLFGGFTNAGEVTGSWVDKHGNVIKDKSRQYWVAVESHREQEVWDLIRDSALLFDQTCIYAAITSKIVHLIPYRWGNRIIERRYQI